MYGFLMSLFVLVAILLVISILLQSSKGGLASSFGGAGGGPGGVMGSRGAANFLQKATIGLGIVFALLCVGINMIADQSEAVQSVTQEELQQQAAPALPTSDIPTALPEALPPAEEDEAPSGDNN